MATADNLFDMTQNFMTPDILQKFSGALGQPVEKIQSGLKSILPTFLMGIANKGSTTEGAQSLMNVVNTQAVDTNTPIANLDNEQLLRKGTDAVNGIFGNSLNSVTSTLSSTTGMNTSTITKMMGLIAPVVMGVIGSKIKREGLSANSLSSFLSSQKSILSRFLPTGIAGFIGGGATTMTSAAKSATESAFSSTKGVYNTSARTLPLTDQRNKSWTLLGLLALCFIGIIWFMSSRRTEVAPTAAPDTISQERAVTTTPTQTGLIEAAPGLNELDSFLASADKAQLPKRFAFQNLVFSTGTADIGLEGMTEIDQIANALKQYPGATARIEGFTDNTGNAEANLDLSTMRAQAVKDQLVTRGIDEARIESVGRGSESPIADNNSDAGRAQNRRIEFILTNLQ